MDAVVGDDAMSGHVQLIIPGRTGGLEAAPIKAQQEKRPGEGGDAGQGSDETPADAKVQGVAQDGGVHLAAAEMPEPAMPDAARASLPVPNGASDGNSISGSITETEMAGLPCLLLTLQQWLGQRTTGALMTKLEARGVVESLYAELGQEAIDRGMEKMAEWFNAREEIAKELQQSASERGSLSVVASSQRAKPSSALQL